MKTYTSKGPIKCYAPCRMIGKGIGGGVGSVLLDGGLGGQSSYSSVDNYISTTGLNPMEGGSIRGSKRGDLYSKLKGLDVKPKSRNIKFNL